MSDDLVEIEVLSNRKRIEGLDDLPEQVYEALEERLRSLMQQMEDMVQDNISDRLKRVSGKLEEAVRMEVITDGMRLSGRVYIEGVPYARIQEQGGTTGAHMIYPKAAKVLAFMAATGDKVLATRVLHPGGTIAGSHFMRDAYREISPKVTDSLYYYTVRKLKAMGYV